MRRPTREQIDVGIVDAAAALFAEHGYERTSLREIAQAVGYSKTGLLHRFASKEALLEAVADRCLEAVQGVLDRVGALPEGPERDAAAVAALVELAVSAPGRLSLALAHEGALHGSPAGDRLEAVPGLLAACFALEVTPQLGDAHLERAARVTAALAAIATVPETFRDRPAAVVAPLLTRIALHVLDARPAPPLDARREHQTRTA